ncbi:uncharacterized protein F5891DRAFT_983078 [Suillus fuscotomentosus]|uniref:Fungal-type protein kinase domain-containing protein n=1 Tax=Suillus fuscotomentosus TaxID=1912939 RepID=A0AAD4HHJ5_9AGAM|nr:uncharacterized protein F5891DRAFT_983078 [Suillus fuscotomentosus]KAG1896848.1 hypothetical protein F5891DRAFT_983078 [Suillus fuscotomentosus]
MPLGKHFCSVGLGDEADIFDESSPANSDELGHVLLLIFKSCMTEVPRAKDLKVPLKKIHPDTRIKAFQHIEDEATLVPLYDTHACRWNWPLPESHLDKLAASGERSNQARENSSMDQGEREGENSGATDQRSGDWDIIDDTGAPAASESQVESLSQPEDDIMSTNASSASSDKAPVLHAIDRDSTKPWMTKQVFASFNNLLTFALLLQKPALTQKHNLSHIWSALNSLSIICGDEITRKPDLTLLDDIEARWDTIKAICELTSSAYLPSHPLAKTLDTKAYLLLKHQLWRHFALLVSICNEYRELHIHLYDHLGGVVSPCTHIDRELDKYLWIFSSIVFGNLECIRLNPTITILKHMLHRTLQSPDFCVAKPSPSPHQTAEVISDALIMESETIEIEEIVSEPPHTIEDAVPNPTANIPPNLVPLIDKVPSDSLSGPLPEPIGKIRVNENTYNILDLIFSTQGLVGRGTVCYLVRKDEEEYIVKDHWVLGSKSEVLNEICMMEKMDGICGVPCLVEYWLVEMEPGEVDKTVKYCQKYSVGGTGTVPFMSRSLLFQLYLHTLDPSDERLEWYDLIKNPNQLHFDNVIDLLGRHIAALLKEDSPGPLVSKWVILSAAGSLMPPQNNEESASPPVDETRQKQVVDHWWMMEAIPKLKRNKTE